MKKNAILIAGIMCAAGLSVKAAPDNGDFYPRDHTIQSTENVDRTPQGNPTTPSSIPTASQYDPASVNAFHADSSIRGGSKEARGFRSYGRTDSDTASKPMNPAVQADSSVRGGSWQGRDRDWNTSNNPEAPLHNSGRVQADSSIRGGSNEARGYDRAAQNSDDMDRDRAASDSQDGDLYLYYFEPRGDSHLNAQSDLNLDSGNLSNANAGEGQLQNRTAANREDSYVDDTDSDSIATGAPATSESGSFSSSLSSSHGVPGESLNSSKNLEKDISGQYSLNPSSSSSSSSADVSGKSASQIQAERMSGSNRDTEQAVGGPGSTESGSNTSVIRSDESSAPENNLGITTDSQKPLFKNNRAQGVGSLATGEFGQANSQDQNSSESLSGNQLAERVKADLVKNSTGTFGVMKSQARNIQVTANGGVVTLKGAVPSERDKQMVEVRVSGMKGVDRVDNQLTISPQANPSARDLDNGRNLEDKTDQLQH